MNQMLHRYVPLSGSYPHTYFAGANTADGFVSAYPHFIREDISHRVFIIKGGSGTGKSSLMKTCARAAEDAGAQITLLLCSSDPSSADAVILQGKNGRRIVLLDGTAPHMTDPELPGAVSEIIDVGQYWDADILASHREEIALARREKQNAYSRAYRYLAAYRQIGDAAGALLSECILHDKLHAAASRIMAGVPAGQRFREEIRYTHALSMHGAYRLNTFSMGAKQTHSVIDAYGTGEFFLEAVRDQAMTRRLAVYTAPSPACPHRIRELYLPEQGIRFHLVPDREAIQEKAQIHCINMHRFIDRTRMADRRARIRFAGKCGEMLFDGALQALHHAGQQHFALEEIYKSAMNFDEVQRKTQELAEGVRALLQ